MASILGFSSLVLFAATVSPYAGPGSFASDSALVRLARLAVPAASAASAEAIGNAAEAASYPALDTVSPWTLRGWGADAMGFHVRGAAKRVWTAPGAAEDKTVFYDAACVGVELDGAVHALGAADYTGGFEGAGYIARYGSFPVAPGVGVVAIFYFHDDGRFRLVGFLGGDEVGRVGTWRLLTRIDYDLAGSGDDLAEFLWSAASEGGTPSPPQFPAREAVDGSLEFSAGGEAYWAASAHEIAVAYPAMPSGEAGVPEPAAFARITDAAHPRFGMVLWNDAAGPTRAVFKAYSAYNGEPSPPADVSTPLQIAGEAPGYPRYAAAGRDQTAFLSVGSAGPWEACALTGKLFQRPDSRPLAVTVRQHPPEYLGGWEFDPDLAVRVTGDGPRSFRNALSDLAGGDLAIARSGDGDVPFLPFEGLPGPGQAVTEAQLHDLMTAERARGAAPAENVRDWRIELMIVDWTLQGEPGAWEAMFDHGAADGNGIAREGAAVFWPALGGRGEEWRRRQAVLSALHGTGLALNMDPSWGACPAAAFCWNDPSGCGGLRCGPACPPGAPGCRYEAYSCAVECAEGSIMSLTDVDRNSLRFNASPAQGSAHSEIDWYRRAPEAWAKPGRFGIGPVSGPMPPFSAQ